MKIRIKGNSIRLRLTKTDVHNLLEVGLVEEKTVFNEHIIFEYQLLVDDVDHISASFENHSLQIKISKENADILCKTDEMSLQYNQENGTSEKLFILIEKDLQCLDVTHEDQTDMYENTKTKC